MKASELLDELDNIARNYNWAEYGLPTHNEVMRELVDKVKEYARIQVEKDREAIKAHPSIANRNRLISDIDNTPINLD